MYLLSITKCSSLVSSIIPLLHTLVKHSYVYKCYVILIVLYIIYSITQRLDIILLRVYILSLLSTFGPSFS